MKNDIRFLVTNACNYNCYFCHNEGISSSIRQHQLTSEDYVTLYKLHSRIEDWKGVTISGGEPFLFRDIDALIRKLFELGADITVVTNGSLISSHFPSMKYVKKINVSIHTTDERIYGNITNSERGKLYIVKENLKTLRELYPEIEIRLNVTPCKSQNWGLMELQNLILFANQIDASIKCIELFPNNVEDCVKIDTLRKQLKELSYVEIPSLLRTEQFKNENSQVFITQCTCSKAVCLKNPVKYCRDNHDLYVNCNATFPLCRLSTESIDFWEDLRENNLEILEMKMKIAKRRVSKEKCEQYLRSVYY